MSPVLEPRLTLDGLRARGAQHFDPVRFSYLEALARRAAAHEGALRVWLDDRLAQALATYAERQARAAAAGDLRPPAAPPTASTAQGQGSALADLVRHLNRAAAPGAAAEALAPAPASPPAELKALRHFRTTWSRLSVEHQLTRSRATVPDNAGPLNTQLIVLRSLQVMRDTSPDYLARFMSQLETLMWLEQAAGGASPAPAAVVRGSSEKPRKPARGKAGKAG